MASQLPDDDSDRNMSLPDQTVGISEAERLSRTEALIAAEHELVFRYAYRLTGCQASAEDISQEVFLRAFKAIDQLRDECAARAWLMTITRNQFARWCQSRAAQRAESAEIESLPNATRSASDEVETEDWVQAAIEQLTPEFRTVTLMYYFEQLSYAEIAEQLGIPIGTVMSRLSRGKSHLKRCLEAVAIPR